MCVTDIMLVMVTPITPILTMTTPTMPVCKLTNKAGLRLNQGRSGLEIECLVPAKLAHFNVIIRFYKQCPPSVLSSSDSLFHGHEDVLRTLWFQHN